MAAEDDFSFSFPTPSHPLNRCGGIDSPPLWHLSPAASPISPAAANQKNRDEEGDREIEAKVGGGREIDRSDNFLVRFVAHRKRFSIGEKAAEERESGGESEAEKMDELWEDFNEELARSRMKKSPAAECVKEFEVSETTDSAGAVAPVRRTGKTVVAKVLKKLFLIQNNSRRKFRARSW